MLVILGLFSSALAQSPPTPPEIPDETQPMPPGIKRPPTPAPTSPTPSATQPESQPVTSQPPAIRAQPKSENGLTYLCGGVGLDESTYMKRTAKEYDLMSTFSSRGGSYLADVNIDISNKSGKAMLQTTCSAPILLIKFPSAGIYRIRAEVGGDIQTKIVQVQAKRSPHSIAFVWPAN
jgi:hypothetical protein